MCKTQIFLFSSLMLLMTTMGFSLDHKSFDAILKANVDAEGYVDYAGIRINKGGDLYQYITNLETVDTKIMTDSQKLAFWINAYNAHVIRLILARPKLEKISDDLPMFDEKFKIARLSISLNTIEHRILRGDPAKGGPAPGLSIAKPEPNVHFGLNCGAIGCPKLSSYAYQEINVKEMLRESAIAFANNKNANRIEEGKVILSSIFKWYSDDFAALGGVLAYITSLTDKKLRADESQFDALLNNPSSQIDYDYNWVINDKKNKK